MDQDLELRRQRRQPSVVQRRLDHFDGDFAVTRAHTHGFSLNDTTKLPGTQLSPYFNL